MAPLRAVLFDYGHTLVDFTSAQNVLEEVYDEVRSLLVAEAYEDLPAAPELVTAVSVRVQEMVEESYQRQELDELDILVLFESALSVLGVTVPRELVHRIAEMEHRALVSEIAILPEITTTLAALRDRGLKIGLVSNAHFLPALMREDIVRLGIAEYVDESVFSSEIGLRKPHPAIFHHVLDPMGVRPDEAIFVGDRLRDDIGGAQSLGMGAVLTQQFRQEDVMPSTAQPDLVIETLPELLPYVDALKRSR